MQLLDAAREGFRGPRGTLVSGGIFYAAGLALALFGSAPWRSAVHSALDGQPGAAALTADGGIAVLAELRRSTPGFWPAVAAPFPLVALVSVPLGLLLVAGAYGVAAERSARPWTEFARSATTRFFPSLAVVAMSLPYALLAVAVAAGLRAGIGLALAEPSGRAVFLVGAAARLSLAVFALVTFRTVLGLALAFREARPAGRLARCVLASVSLSWRRFTATHGLSAMFLAAQAVATAAALAGDFIVGRGGLFPVLLAQVG